MNIPKDPIMLMSIINTLLRDQYGNLDLLCDDCGLDKNEICEKLKSVGYEYSQDTNQFC